MSDPHLGTDSSETTALLSAPQRPQSAAAESTPEPSHRPLRSRATSIGEASIRTIQYIKNVRARFWGFCALGIVAIIILNFTFLPRTSLSRDYRRWHGLHLTKTDVKRDFLNFAGIGNSHNSLTTEEYINTWLTNLTEINKKSDVNLVADDNIELLTYIKNNFKEFGFQTNSYTYDFPDLERPLSLSLQLIDTQNDVIFDANLLEPNFKTPAYNGFGANGTVKTDYVFVNEGTFDDYQLLFANKIFVENKIVIVKSLLGSDIATSEKILLAESYGASGFVYYYDFTSNNNFENEGRLNMAISRDTAGFGNVDSLKKPSIVSIPVSFKIADALLGTLPSGETSKPFKHWGHYPIQTSSIFQLLLSANFQKEDSRKLTNIVGTLKGIMNDGQIVIGAKRDSFTSANPLSSHAVMLEIMRNFQRLVKVGWKPLRTIKFVSWDGSNNGLVGSQLFANDTKAFDPKIPIISYINIDGDCVVGSKFHVDANPSLNHVLRRTAKFIPIPKASASFKMLSENDKEDNYDDDDDSYTTLHRYWMKQDNLTINNVLGRNIVNSDSLVFQHHLNTPVINLRFDSDVKRDASIYVPNSNYYSYNWLMKRKIDQDLLFHGLLIRYLGLLAITLSEHEVVDYRSNAYFSLIEKSYGDFTDDHSDVLAGWFDETVSSYLISKTSIYQDLETDSEDGEVKFGDLLHQLRNFLNASLSAAAEFDDWNLHVQDNLIIDYPWYKYFKKLGHFAQFKLANYKLLHLEKQLRLSSKDYTFLGINETYFNHVFYGVATFSLTQNNTQSKNRSRFSTFTALHEAIEQQDFELAVKWLAVVYDKLRNLNWFL